jgi:hypothetical protein
MDGVEPRIHFALVCGAKSCPPIKTYHPDTLEESLTLATEVNDKPVPPWVGEISLLLTVNDLIFYHLQSYLEQTTSLDPVRRVVNLSKLLSWYQTDFGTQESDVLRFVASYVSDSKRSVLLRMLDSDETVRICYDPYDWSVNKK